jgi:hypothetical protein
MPRRFQPSGAGGHERNALTASVVTSNEIWSTASKRPETRFERGAEDSENVIEGRLSAHSRDGSSADRNRSAPEISAFPPSRSRFEEGSRGALCASVAPARSARCTYLRRSTRAGICDALRAFLRPLSRWPCCRVWLARGRSAPSSCLIRSYAGIDVREGRMRRYTVRSTIATFFLSSLLTSTQVRDPVVLDAHTRFVDTVAFANQPHANQPPREPAPRRKSRLQQVPSPEPSGGCV